MLCRETGKICMRTRSSISNLKAASHCKAKRATPEAQHTCCVEKFMCSMLALPIYFEIDHGKLFYLAGPKCKMI